MADIVLQDVDATVLGRLSERARRHGRSLEDETKAILARAALNDLDGAAEFAARMRARLSGRRHSNSADLVAEDRGR